MVGATASATLPVVNPMQKDFKGGASDALLANFAPYRPDPDMRLVSGGGQPNGPAYDFYMSRREAVNENFVRFLNDAQANPCNARGTNMYFDARQRVVEPEHDA